MAKEQKKKRAKENRRMKYEQIKNINKEIKNYNMELNRNSERHNNQNENSLEHFK